MGKHKATVQAGQIYEKTGGPLQCATDTKVEELSGMWPCCPRVRGQLEYSNVQMPPSNQSLQHIVGSRAGSESNSTITLLSKPQAGA